jgi:hypothetical protein
VDDDSMPVIKLDELKALLDKLPRPTETQRAQYEAEQREILDYGGLVNWGVEVNRVMLAVKEFGPYTRLWIRRPNAKQFAAELRSLLPFEVSRSVTFLLTKPIRLLITEGPPAPGSFDLHYEYDYPPSEPIAERAARGGRT